MPQPRSQLVTVRRPRAKSSPVQSCTNRACWRASSVPAKVVIQTTSDTGSHCDSIHGSPSHDSVAISNHSMRGEPPHLKSPPASGTPNEVPDFWESADAAKTPILGLLEMIGLASASPTTHPSRITLTKACVLRK